MQNQNHLILLGGYDAEMLRIRQLAEYHGLKYADRKVPWGPAATASLYKEEIESAKQPIVLIELTVDIPLPKNAVIIDHHGARAGEPASILQFLQHFDIKPTRWDEIIAVNDGGWFPGLIAMGATIQEMRDVRAADAKAQGITPEQVQEAERALSAPEEWVGPVRVIRMAHSKMATIGDVLAIKAIERGAKSINEFTPFILFSEDGEVNYSGDGATAASLANAFQGPNSGAGGIGLGKANGSGYWFGYPNHSEVLAFLKRRYP